MRLSDASVAFQLMRASQCRVAPGRFINDNFIPAMVPSVLSADDAPAPNQRQSINEAPFTKEPLPAVLNPSSDFPYPMPEKRSAAEEDLFALMGTSAPPPSLGFAPPQPLTGEKGLRRTVLGTSGEHIDNSTSQPAGRKVQSKQEQQQEHARASTFVRAEPPELSAPDCLQASSFLAEETRAVTPPGVASSAFPATSATCSTATGDVCDIVSQLYQAGLVASSTVPCNRSLIDSGSERNRDISRESGTDTPAGVLPAATAAFADSPSPSGSVESLPQAPLATCSDHAPATAAPPLASAEVLDDNVRYSGLTIKTETSACKGRVEELHGTAAVSPASSTTPRKLGAGQGGLLLRGRGSVKEDDAATVISRLDYAVDALVAHAEEQAEQMRKLTMLVEDLSIKLDNLQESLLSGRVAVHPNPPPVSEVRSQAGATETRQSRGRMVPPPLPRGRGRESHTAGSTRVLCSHIIDDVIKTSVREAWLPLQTVDLIKESCGRNVTESKAATTTEEEDTPTQKLSIHAAQREADIEAMERRRLEEQREAQRREEERLRREEAERKRREELMRRAAEEQRRREALDEKRKNIISSLISNKAGSSLFGDDAAATSHRGLFDD